MAELDPTVGRGHVTEQEHAPARGRARARARVKLRTWHVSRPRHLLALVAATCALFVVLTTLAMLVYPGGTFPVAQTHGYQFFVNYFSDLGQTRTQSGVSNYPSMMLFTSAVMIVGLALAAFFVAFSTVFRTKASAPAALRLNRVATRFGLASAACFIGLAAIPENLFAAGHFLCVQGAFNFLLVAIVLEIVALRGASGVFSSWLLVVYATFVVVLFGYVLLLLFGPSSKSLIGDEINAVGQKIIVYVAVATIFAQALIVRAHLPRTALRVASPPSKSREGQCPAHKDGHDAQMAG